MSVAADDTHVREVRLGRAAPRKTRRNRILELTVAQLREYFAGKRRAFALPLRLDLTRFTAGVLMAVDAIPYGTTKSYGSIAAEVGRPAAARAVGRAVGANPLPVLIPCHRVLAGGGGLGGFGAGLRWKRFLLSLEATAASRG